MKNRYLIYILIIAFLVAGFVVYYLLRITKSNNPSSEAVTATATLVSTPTPQATVSPQSAFAEPVTDFKTRVTKKPFGIHITPQDSPVQPERFAGYHTGADAEYEDVTDDVVVYAIASGSVVLSETASGYGGVFMISFDLNGTAHTALYGHIRPSSLPKKGVEFKKGDPLALLGTEYSSETDGERRHLHFAILSDDRLDIKGYVQTKSELSGWIDPLTLLP